MEKLLKFRGYTLFIFLLKCSCRCSLCIIQNGLTALHFASKEGHEDIVTELLVRGADVDALTEVRDYKTTLFIRFTPLFRFIILSTLGGPVVTPSSITSEVSGSNLGPYVGKLVGSYRWSAVYSTKP